MTPELTRQLFDYNHWANNRALDAAAQLSDDQFVKPLGSSFSSVRDTLAHICGGEIVWLDRFHGNSPSAFPDTANLNTVATLREFWNPYADKLLAFANNISQAELDRVFEYKTFNFGVYQNPLWQSMQHLANHGTYHRGQVATMLRQLGAKPILTDLMHFYRERATASSASA
jgi:uncharacterized damage-inducible protein DinB